MGGSIPVPLAHRIQGLVGKTTIDTRDGRPSNWSNAKCHANFFSWYPAGKRPCSTYREYELAELDRYELT